MSENCGIMENLKVPPPCLPDRPLGEQETFPVIGGAQGDNALTNTLIVNKSNYLLSYNSEADREQGTFPWFDLHLFFHYDVYECIFTMS